MMSPHRRMQELVLKSGCSWASQEKRVKEIDGISRTDEHLLPKGPFAGLTICVTGLSKEARKQVQITTEKLGGKYSPDLHLGCTHLVVQRCSGRKYEHALKHKYSKKGLHVVTLAWFVNSARHNDRLDESHYDVTKRPVESEPADGVLLNELTGGDPTCIPQKPFNSMSSLDIVPAGKLELLKQKRGLLANMCFYIDVDVPSEMQIKVVEAAVKEGATCISDWYIGCNATHIICDEKGIGKYVGYKTHLVSPLWVLKTVKERSPQHVVHISLDLVRHFPYLLEQQLSKQSELRNGYMSKKLLALTGQEDAKAREMKLEQAEQKIRAAKASIRRRRGPTMQPCRTVPRPITPQSMMESICWSISEPPSTAQLYLDDQVSDYFDAHDSGKEYDQGANEVSVRPLSESEKQDVVYKGSFLTMLFPVDRFSEMGPCSRSFFREKGFTRQQILENVYAFYQEPMSAGEIEVAIHTDSKHGDRLRAVYAAPETLDLGYIPTKRYEFLGSRRNFEGLRRLSVENNGQVFQLCLGS